MTPPITKNTFRELTMLCALAAAGCNLTDDPETDGGGSSGEPSDNEACIQEVALLDCVAPAQPTVLHDFGNQNIVVIDDPNLGGQVGVGGLFGQIGAGADLVVTNFTDYGTCATACVYPASHPCARPTNDYCYVDSDPYCVWCGDGSAAECAEFVQACAAIDEGNESADGSTSWGDDSGGAVDVTGEESNIGPVVDDPDVLAFFASHPDVVYGTNQYTYENLFSSPPPNLVWDADAALCATWSPATEVTTFVGIRRLKLSTFQGLLEDYAPLDTCDGLRVSLENNQLTFTEVEPGTLAHALGFRSGETVVRINGSSDTSAPALIGQALAIAASRAALVTVRAPSGRTRTLQFLLTN